VILGETTTGLLDMAQLLADQPLPAAATAGDLGGWLGHGWV
jgi:hypothetical protein